MPIYPDAFVVFIPTLSFFPEEILHERAAFVFQHATDDFGLGMEHLRSITTIAPLLVGSAIDHTPYLRPT